MTKTPLSAPPGGPLVYVDCGARGVANLFQRAFRTAEYIGFEPDAEECARLVAKRKKRRRYFPLALGGRAGRRLLHVTRSPACSSLLPPNLTLLRRFRECGALFEVVAEREVETVSLDEHLAAEGIQQVDVLKLDTQGSELEILEGADDILRRSVLAVQVEVEFAQMYRDQPLFGAIDEHLRARGFQLFDLATYRGRRATLAPEQPTRGQLLWGQAVYLRELDAEEASVRHLRLAALARFYGVPDYALEVIEAIFSGSLDEADGEVARVWRDELRGAKPGRLAGFLDEFEDSAFQAVFRRLGDWWLEVGDAFVEVTRRRAGTWRD